jgi:hypothetical protein
MMDQNTFNEVKCSSLTKYEISLGKKQEAGFQENEVKFDFLNKKNVAYCELLSRPSDSGGFDVKIKSSDVKVQEDENYMYDGTKNERRG